MNPQLRGRFVGFDAPACGSVPHPVQTAAILDTYISRIQRKYHNRIQTGENNIVSDSSQSQHKQDNKSNIAAQSGGKANDYFFLEMDKCRTGHLKLVTEKVQKIFQAASEGGGSTPTTCSGGEKTSWNFEPAGSMGVNGGDSPEG